MRREMESGYLLSALDGLIERPEFIHAPPLPRMFSMSSIIYRAAVQSCGLSADPRVRLHEGSAPETITIANSHTHAAPQHAHAITRLLGCLCFPQFHG
jgi:hypothetical protein